MLEAARLARHHAPDWGRTCLQRLQAGLPADLPVSSSCPSSSPAPHGLRTTHQMAQSLGEELGH